MEVSSSSHNNLYEESSDSEEEEEDLCLNQDLEALRRACMVAGAPPPDPNHNQFHNLTTSSISDSDEEGSNDTNDDELVLKIQQTLSNLTSSFDNNNKIEEPVYFKPLRSVEPVGLSDVSDNDDDDYDTLRAIQRRFDSYITTTTDSIPKGNESLAEENSSIDGTKSASKTPQCFLDAIKKNRALQRHIRSKMIQIEEKIEENKKLKERMKLLRDFRRICQRRARRALRQNHNALLQLISACRSRKMNLSKVSDRKICPLFFGPVENSHVVNYRNVLQINTPGRTRRWSDTERENLGKGIKQQLQEEVWLQNSLELYSDPNVSYEDCNAFDDMLASIANYDFPPETIRSFVPKVDWDRLASLYVPGHSGAECEARWLNHEDPLICHDPWTEDEDKNILFIVEKCGMYNWISVSTKMKTNRTPFQCFARFQRSLNPSVMKRDWTVEDDTQLCAAVEAFGTSDWQRVASNVAGRTGAQCSTRWMKTLNPARKRVGRWTVQEDKLLKVAVMIFGAKIWNKIAKFVPGRTQAQCRERWVNALDPSLKRAPWTEEEDSRLREAFLEHGYCWSKVAQAVPHRSDSQCLKRWKVLFPDEVPKLQAARRIKKLALVANFVDREGERPALGPCDFIPLAIENTPAESETFTAENCTSKKKRKGLHFDKTSSTENQSEGKPTSRKKRKVEPHSEKNESMEPELCDSQETVVDGKSSQGTVSSRRKRKVKPKLLSGRKDFVHLVEDQENCLLDDVSNSQVINSGGYTSSSLLRKCNMHQQDRDLKSRTKDVSHSQDIAEALDDDLPLVHWLRVSHFEEIAETLADDVPLMQWLRPQRCS